MKKIFILLIDHQSHRCSREVDVDLEAITECAKGEEGNLLHKLAGDKTNSLRPKVKYFCCKYFMMFTMLECQSEIFI